MNDNENQTGNKPAQPAEPSLRVARVLWADPTISLDEVSLRSGIPIEQLNRLLGPKTTYT